MQVRDWMALLMASSFSNGGCPCGKQPIMPIRKMLRTSKEPRHAHAGPGASIDCCLSLKSQHGNRTGASAPPARLRTARRRHPPSGPGRQQLRLAAHHVRRPGSAHASNSNRPGEPTVHCSAVNRGGRRRPQRTAPPRTVTAHQTYGVSWDWGRRRRSSSSEARRHRPRIPVAGRGPRERAKTSRIDVAHTLATGGSMWRVLHLL